MIHYVKDVKVERLSDFQVKFTCPKGHESTKDFSKGPVAKRMGKFGLDKMVPYWQDRITYDCKRCERGN